MNPNRDPLANEEQTERLEWLESLDEVLSRGGPEHRGTSRS
jgi:hypothetical protein